MPMPTVGNFWENCNANPHKPAGKIQDTFPRRHGGPPPAPTRHLAWLLPATFADRIHPRKARVLPNGPKRNHAYKHTPVDSIHKRIVLSPEPDTIVFSSGVKDTDQTGPVWPLRTFCFLPVMRERGARRGSERLAQIAPCCTKHLPARRAVGCTAPNWLEHECAVDQSVDSRAVNRPEQSLSNLSPAPPPQQWGCTPRTAPPDPGTASSHNAKHTPTYRASIAGDSSKQSWERMQGRPWSHTGHKTDCTPRQPGTGGNAPNKRAQPGSLGEGTVGKTR